MPFKPQKELNGLQPARIFKGFPFRYVFSLKGVGSLLKHPATIWPQNIGLIGLADQSSSEAAKERTKSEDLLHTAFRVLRIGIQLALRLSLFIWL